MIIEGINERQGSWYVTRFVLARKNRDRNDDVDLGRADWADWSSCGDLLLARAGKLHRVPRRAVRGPDPWAAARELIDLSSLSFEERAPPAEARRWTGSPPRGVSIPRR